MPGMDGMGPMGMGPGTGWARGLCYGYGPYAYPGYFSNWGPGWGAGFGWGRGRGFGAGFGRGFGRGFRRGYWAGGAPASGWYGYDAWGPPSRGEEVSWLKERGEMLKAEMEAVQRRIDELAAEKES